MAVKISKKYKDYAIALENKKETARSWRKNHRLSFYTDRRYMVRLLLMMVFAATLTIFLFATSFSISLTKTSFFALGIFCLFYFILFILPFIYFLSLFFQKEPLLVFDDNYLIDQSSFFNFGKILFSDIVSLSVTDKWWRGILVVKIDSRSQIWTNKNNHSFWMRVYSFIFFHRLFIFLDFLLIDPQELTQAMQLFNFFLSSNRESQRLRRSPPLSSLMGREKQKNKNLSPPSFESQDKHELEESSGTHMIPDQRLMKKILKIKSGIRESKFDSLFCDLYSDEIPYLMKILESSHRGESSCDEIKGVRQLKKERLEEKVQIDYKQHKLIIDLDKGSLHKKERGLLTLHFDGQEVFQLGVRFEIGELSPESVKKFISGHWEQLVREIYQLSQNLRRKINHEEEEQEEEKEKEKMEDMESIEELKKNFGFED